MSQKMQQLLDLIVNEEMDKANELFHEIVVEKSREIYENLIAEEAEEDEEEEMDESSEEDEDESVEEGFGPEGGDEEGEMGGDAADAFVSDVGDDEANGDDMGGDDMGGDGSAPATRDDVQDLEDALAELKAEFEALMGGSTGGDEEEFGDEEGGEENPFGDEEDSEEDGEEDGEEADDEEAEESMRMGVREYRETVGNDWHKNSMKSPGPVGSGKGDKAGQTSVEGTKSIVASGKGKPTTGANANNILGDTKTGEGTNVGTSPNADKGSRGLVGSTKGEFTKGVEKNISSSSKTGMKSGSDLAKNSAGHGAERKGSGPGPVGSGSGDKAGQTSVGQVKSPLNGAPNRNA